MPTLRPLARTADDACDHANGGCQTVDEKLRLAGVTGGEAFGLRSRRRVVHLFEVDQRQRMNLDERPDDELFARQPNGIVRQHGKPQRFFGVSDVHHDLGALHRDWVRIYRANWICLAR